jgi:integrase
MRIATQSQVHSAPPGRHNAGPCLYLIVSADHNNRRWALRYHKPSTGKPTEFGLGKAELVTLREALNLAFDCRRSIAKGIDPVDAKRDQRRLQITFAEMANAFISIKQQEIRSYTTIRFLLQTYASSLATKHLSSITPDDIESTLRPIWARSRTQGKRTLSAIYQVFELAISKGFCTANPADWRIMKRRFPKVGKSQHYSAMDYIQVPAFMKRLHIAQEHGPALSPFAIEFLILTACRASEVVGMRWSEVDLDARVWTIPATRTKTNNERRVPLSDRAVELLRKIRPRLHQKTEQESGAPSDYIWPSRRPGSPIGAKALYLYLTRYMKVPVTLHGFRSSFRDFAGNETHFDRVTCELALGHRAGDATEIAYRRSDALTKRRALMDAWTLYCKTGL